MSNSELSVYPQQDAETRDESTDEAPAKKQSSKKAKESGTGFRGKRLVIEELTEEQARDLEVSQRSEHTILHQVGGQRGAELRDDDDVAHRINRHRTTTLLPAGQQAKMSSDAVIQMLRLSLSDRDLCEIAETKFGIDTSTLEVFQAAGANDTFMRHLASVIQLEMEQRDAHADHMLDCFDAIVALHILRSYSNFGTPARKYDEGHQWEQDLKAIEDAKAYIQQNLAEPIKMIDVAQAVGLTKLNLARLFKEMTGQTAHQYLLETRIAHACDLLRDTKKPLASVAVESGFTTQSYFTAAFGKRMGTTPGDYRRNSAKSVDISDN
ncbi:MAG: AraC family transcriptional regulator [Pseudomonadota bacterium]